MSVIRKFGSLAVAPALAAAVFVPLLAASPALAAKDGDTFGDWTVSCPKAPANAPANASTCRLMQIEKVKGSDGKEVSVLKAAIFHLNDKEFVLFGYLPLGYAIPPGVKVSVDGGKEYELFPQRCIPQGCEAANKLDAEMLGAMKKGSNAKIEFRIADKVGTIAVSLKGLSEGLSKF